MIVNLLISLLHIKCQQGVLFTGPSERFDTEYHHWSDVTVLTVFSTIMALALIWLRVRKLYLKDFTSLFYIFPLRKEFSSKENLSEDRTIFSDVYLKLNY